MNHDHRPIRRAAVACLAACALGAVQAATHLPQFTAVDITPPGGAMCMTYGLNASGQVAGVLFADTGYQSGHGFVTGPQGVGVTMVGTVGSGTLSALVAVDDAGNAAGFAFTTPGTSFQTTIAVAAGSGTPVDLGALGGSLSSPNAMSDRDEIVGVVRLQDGSLAGYTASRKTGGRLQPMGVNVFPQGVTRDGRIVGAAYAPDFSSGWAFITGPGGQGMVTLGSLGGGYSGAYGVNRHGQVVGDSTLADGSTVHAFVTGAGGTGLRDVGVPGLYVTATKINAHGQIIGNFVPTSWSDPSRPFLAYPNGHWWDLSAVALGEGRTVARVTDINDAGQIAAMSSDQRCFLLTPKAR